ncbi:MAG: ketoacyl-ACP synthase III [Myxococcota bacterium]
MRNAKIASVGMYAPERVLDNAYFDELLGKPVAGWLEENVEIFTRRWAADDESSADMASAAARQAMERAGVEPADIDLIVVATDTPEQLSPSTASVVQHQLGATNAGSFDLNSACSGFVAALDVASKYIRGDDQYDHVLVIGVYAMSKYLNKRDHRTVSIFADGAGAIVLSATDQDSKGFLASKLETLGAYYDAMGVYAGGTAMPISDEAIANHDHQLKFVRKFPAELNPDNWTRLIRELTARIGVSPKDVDNFFITQINVHAIRETLDRLEVPHERAHTVMHHFGYTGSACIPMCMADALDKGVLATGQLLVFLGSGGGVTFATAAFQY